MFQLQPMLEPVPDAKNYFFGAERLESCYTFPQMLANAPVRVVWNGGLEGRSRKIKEPRRGLKRSESVSIRKALASKGRKIKEPRRGLKRGFSKAAQTRSGSTAVKSKNLVED